MQKNLTFALGVMGLVCLGVAQAKTPCLITGTADLGLSIPVKMTPGSTIAVDDCSSLVVTNGSASVFLRNSNGNSYRIKLSAGDRLQAKLPTSAGSVDFENFYSALSRFAGGDIKSSIGGKYAFDSRPILGFPADDIAIPRGPVAINFARVVETVQAFQILDEGGRTVFKVTNQRGPFQVPAATLRPGAKYEWTLEAKDLSAQGSFSVLTKELDSDVQAELRETLKGIAMDDPDRAVLEALTYEHHALSYNRDLAASRIKNK